MKKILSLILLLSLLLTTAACGTAEELVTLPPESTAEETQTSPATEQEDTFTEEEMPDSETEEWETAEKNTEEEDPPLTEETPSSDYTPTIRNPLTWTQVNALPIANASMSVQQLRDICWEFMAFQLNIGWTPNADFTSREREDVAYRAGTLYGGMPYCHKSFTNLYQMMYYYNDQTGEMDIERLKANGIATAIRDNFDQLNDVSAQFSNQCSSSTLWAWSRVSDQVAWDGSDEVLPHRGAVILGDALSAHLKAYYPNLKNYSADKIYTADILKSAGQKTVFEAYALLQKADGLVQYKAAGGHVRMVHHVDLDTQTVYLQEQTYGREKSGTTHPGAYKGVSFAKLFSDGYIPFTIPEFVGKSPVEQGSVSFSHSVATATVGELLSATVSSSYMISDVTVTVSDADGKEKAEYFYTSSVNYYLFAGQAQSRTPLRLKGGKGEHLGATEAQFAPYADGQHTVRIRVRISTGEVFDVYSGKLVK
ncbi:MAG: hypothetical protein IJC84_04930 [Clostridia bacterium]|nr:hypothetical protein [Clostridia bacterium]